MTTIRIRLEGVDKWEHAIDELIYRLADATYEATADSLHMIERAEKTLLALRPHPPGTPTPSPPGSPPGMISGHLLRGVEVDGPHQMSLTRVEGAVGPTAIYARIQEMGGHTGRGHRTYLPPRPYHTPTVDALLPLVYETYALAWARAIDDAMRAGG